LLFRRFSISALRFNWALNTEICFIWSIVHSITFSVCARQPAPSVTASYRFFRPFYSPCSVTPVRKYSDLRETLISLMKMATTSCTKLRQDFSGSTMERRIIARFVRAFSVLFLPFHLKIQASKLTKNSISCINFTTIAVKGAVISRLNFAIPLHKNTI